MSGVSSVTSATPPSSSVSARRCQSCRRPDSPLILRDEPCTCPAADSWAPDADHDPSCARVAHEVREYVWPKLYRTNELVRDVTGRAGSLHGYRLPPDLVAHGWRLREAPADLVPGQRVFARWKLLCRRCIVDELDRAARLREYQDASKRAERKDRTLDWASTVAAQDSL